VRHLQASASAAIQRGEENRDTIISGFPRSEINLGFESISIQSFWDWWISFIRLRVGNTNYVSYKWQSYSLDIQILNSSSPKHRARTKFASTWSIRPLIAPFQRDIRDFPLRVKLLGADETSEEEFVRWNDGSRFVLRLCAYPATIKRVYAIIIEGEKKSITRRHRWAFT